MHTTQRLSLFLALGTSACYSVEYAPMATDTKTPNIASFAASLSEVASGQTVDLAYQVTDAETVAITTDRGESVLPASTVLVGTAFSRPLTMTTSFILTATNKDKTATKTVSVTVTAVEAPKHAVVVSFDGPNSIDTGASAMLIWRTIDAATGVIKAGDNVVLTIATTDLATGSYMAGPSTDTVYTLAVQGTDGQEVTMTRLVSVSAMGTPQITGRQLYDRNVAPIMQAKCQSCHQGAAPDINGPNFLGASSAQWYTSIAADARFLTQVPENSMFLLKGEHAGPAFCNPTNANSAGLNHNCSPTTEEQTVTAWLLKESQERFGTQTPPTTPPPARDYTPRTVSEALTRFGACMLKTDWDETYGQSNNTKVANQNSTQGPCSACHSAGTGGSFLSANSDDTFDYNKMRPFVLKLVASSAPNPDGTFNPTLVPSYRYRDKAAGDGTHPNYVLSDERNTALNQFVTRTLTRYSNFTAQCP